MKRLLWLFGGIISMLSCSGQYQRDEILVELIREIDFGWTMMEYDSSLVLESKEPMWIDFYNIAGAPPNDPAAAQFTPEYLQKEGQMTKAKMEFRKEARWSEAQFSEARAQNQKKQAAIDQLLKKHKIDHLKRSYRWHEELFWGETEAEEKRIEAYRAEKTRLESEMVELPPYRSRDYSLFLLSTNWGYGDINGSHMLPQIYPPTELKKINALEKSVQKILTEK